MSHLMTPEWSQAISDDYSSGLITFYYEDRVISGMQTSVLILVDKQTQEIVGEGYGIYVTGDRIIHDFGASWYISPRGQVFDERATPPPPDQPKDVHFSIADASVSEGNSGTTQLQFTITLDRPLPDGYLSLGITDVIAHPEVYRNAQIWSGGVTGDWTEGEGQAVTFLPGETARTISVDVVGDTLIEPDETFEIQIGVMGSSGNFVVQAADASAKGTIVNDDGPAQDVSVSIPSPLDPVLQSLLKADLAAAVGRIEALVPNVPHLEIQINFADLPDDTFAETAGVVSVIDTGGRGAKKPAQMLIENALFEAVTGKDPNGPGPDIVMTLNPDVLADWYSGKSTYDSTTILTHELLHGLGVGMESSDPSIPTSWDLHVIGKEFVSKTTGRVPLTDDEHVALESSLMWPYETGAMTLSALDVAILNELGYGKDKPAWNPKKAEIVSLPSPITEHPKAEITDHSQSTFLL